MEERWGLCVERLKDISKDPQLHDKWGSYFTKVASFLLDMADLYEKTYDVNADCKAQDESKAGCANGGRKNLHDRKLSWDKEIIEKCYDGLRENNYVNSYTNPTFAVEKLGKEHGRLLSALYFEMYSLPAYIAEGDIDEIVIRFELFIGMYCIYHDFCETYTDDYEHKMYQEAKEYFYFFFFDYYDVESEKRVGEKVDPSFDFAYQLIMQADLSTPDYLYQFGEYISDNEIKTIEALNKMPAETLQKMADTYTEGYRIGFIKGNKDLSKKAVAQIVYPLGFEKVVKLAIANFEKMGLQVTLMRTPHSLFHRRGTAIGGYYGTSPNRQFDYDHREDDALFLDGKMVTRRLEVLKEGYIKYEDISKKHAGPAWIEVFGEHNFEPEDKAEACAYDEKQQKLSVQYAMNASKIINTYVPGGERSFTIIAFPIPEIGKDYEAIMEETIALNTLPYKTYEDVQQTIIDALDQCESVCVEGMNGNRTNLQIALCKLKDASKETKFENCVADVNIPVGEVFTSPVLKGTNGLLHVKRVFLNGLSFENLEIKFKDGMTDAYDCSNYADASQNQKYIKDHILHHYESIPMGEFAVGTNTTAYVMGRKYDIEDKLPILIAEKTGPHFAVGDTCYSHAEDVAVYNEDGKEIIARDNEVSILRKDEATKDKAYYACHTDITIPYDELGRLYGVRADGEQIDLIVNGRFVLPGTEYLNEPFK